METLARRPSSAVAVDANVLLSMILGRRSRHVLGSVRARRTVITSDRVVAEVESVLAHVAVADRGELLAEILHGIGVIPLGEYLGLLPAAEATLRHAAASRNGSVRDAHVLACAWAYDADIWTHDRDFAGTGWPSWSNANLGRALAEEAAGPV